MRALWPGLAPSADSICFVVGFHGLFEADFERQEVLDGFGDSLRNSCLT
jgi:hypothetical protein